MSGGIFTLNEVAGKWRWLCGSCDAHGRSRLTAQQAQDDFYAARHVHCPRPECGGEVHADPWGVSIPCPHIEPVVQADTGRRCPRCDCPDGHEQCQHCKICPHASDAAEPDAQPDGEGQPEAPADEDENPALPVRPDPRQPAYDAVYEYVRGLGGYLPPDPVHRNAVIWRAVHAALGATPVGRCVSSHCVEGGHILPVEGETP